MPDFDRAFVGWQHHFGLDCKPITMVGDDLGIGLAHRRFDHLGHGGFAVQALEMGNRHLSGPEAAQLHTALEVVQALIDLGFKVGCRDHDAIFALEARCGSFGDLHRHCSSRPLLRVRRPLLGKNIPPCWCGRRGSNPHDFRHGNLNPARLPIPPRPRQEGGPAARLISRAIRRATRKITTLAMCGHSVAPVQV